MSGQGGGRGGRVNAISSSRQSSKKVKLLMMSDVTKKAMTPRECGARLLPQFTQPIAGSMESKGDQIQCQ